MESIRNLLKITKNSVFALVFMDNRPAVDQVIGFGGAF